MAKLYFGGTPFGNVIGGLGSLGGGLAEGLYMGQDLSMRRKQMEQAEKHQQLQAAMQMLGLGAKVEDPQFIEALNQLMPQLGMPPGMKLPVVDPAQRAQREASTEAAGVQARMDQARAMQIQPGSAEWQKFVFGAVLRDKTELVPYTLGDGRTVMLDANRVAQMENQRFLKEIALAAHGARGGGGGSGKMVLWRGPNGEPIYAPKGPPPVPGAVPTTASAFDRPEEVPAPIPFEERKEVGRIQAKKDAGQTLTPEENAVIAPYIGMLGTPPASGGSVNPMVTQLPPTFAKPPKKRKRSATEPPAAQGPPTRQQGTDEEPPD